MHRGIFFTGQANGQPQNPFVAATEHGQRPVRGHPGEFFVVLEVIRKLGAFLLLAFQHPGAQLAFLPEPLTQLADQLGVFGKALHQNLLGTVESGLGIFDGGHFPFCRAQVACRFVFRVEGGVGQQRIRQRFETGFPGNLSFGAALFLEREVEVFRALLGVGGLDGGLERGSSLPCSSMAASTASRRSSSSRR